MKTNQIITWAIVIGAGYFAYKNRKKITFFRNEEDKKILEDTKTKIVQIYEALTSRDWSKNGEAQQQKAAMEAEMTKHVNTLKQYGVSEPQMEAEIKEKLYQGMIEF